METKLLSPTFEDNDVRIYIYKILQALEFSHRHGIMHRDVKPLNIVIDHSAKELRLIDWGLADYYIPEKEYNVVPLFIRYMVTRVHDGRNDI